jgi:peptide/nickel transport system ATP-binding protein
MNAPLNQERTPESAALLDVIELAKRFPVKTAQGKGELLAVDQVGLQVFPGEAVGLVGESGCGKSTLIRLLTRTLPISSGKIFFLGEDIGQIEPGKMPAHPSRAKLQMVFQDAQDSLNPRYTAFDAIAEPLRLLGPPMQEAQLRAHVAQIATLTGLSPELLGRFPHQLSGGQKARVGIARAAVLRPALLLLDEPTAALDVSVQVVILQLLATLRRSLDMSMLFVSHDLNVVRLLCDRILVMYLGRIVESGPTSEVFNNPRHPYTRALIASNPASGRDPGPYLLEGEPQSPIRMAGSKMPTGCGFHGRCPNSRGAGCTDQTPVLSPVLSPVHSPVQSPEPSPVLSPVQARPQHQVACHFASTLADF